MKFTLLILLLIVSCQEMNKEEKYYQNIIGSWELDTKTDYSKKYPTASEAISKLKNVTIEITFSKERSYKYTEKIEGKADFISEGKFQFSYGWTGYPSNSKEENDKRIEEQKKEGPNQIVYENFGKHINPLVSVLLELSSDKLVYYDPIWNCYLFLKKK